MGMPFHKYKKVSQENYACTKSVSCCQVLAKSIRQNSDKLLAVNSQSGRDAASQMLKG